jgi:SAM-dependent methyltransferase
MAFFRLWGRPASYNMDCSANYFDLIARLPDAYAQPSTAEAQSHQVAAFKLFEQSVSFLETLALSDGARVLDVGAGYGFHCAWFAQRGCRVTGISAHVTEELREHAREHGYEFLPGDMHHLEFADDSFDLVWSHHSLEHSHSPLTALRDWYRVARKNGWVAVTVPPHKNDIVSGHFHTGWSVGQLLYLLGVAGFELRGGTYLEEGYNVRALVRRPLTELEATGASWMFRLKDRFPASLQTHLRFQPGSLGQWSFPGRIQFLNDERCDLLADPIP